MPTKYVDNVREKNTITTSITPIGGFAIRAHKVCRQHKREKYNYYINNLNEVDALLKIGAQKAAVVTNIVLARVREKLGFEV